MEGGLEEREGEECRRSTSKPCLTERRVQEGKKARVLLSWSSGKDSAWALHVLQSAVGNEDACVELFNKCDLLGPIVDPSFKEDVPAGHDVEGQETEGGDCDANEEKDKSNEEGEEGDYEDIEIIGLLTTVNEKYKRVAMHAIKEEILQLQAKAVGYPLHVLYIPDPCTMEQYEELMMREMSRLKRDLNLTHIASGDLYLEWVRRHRVKNLRKIGLKAMFPLWAMDTTELAYEMCRSGVEAWLVNINPKQIDKQFAGMNYTKTTLDLLQRLYGTGCSDGDAKVDLCAENGEFHTLCVNGPAFSFPLGTFLNRKGVVERGGHYYLDVDIKSKGEEEEEGEEEAKHKDKEPSTSCCSSAGGSVEMEGPEK
eukprot:Nk52_evm67s236 gene=Nk52_evmTU67s236